MFKIIIFASDHQSFLKNKNKIEAFKLKPESIIWCDSSVYSRSSVINANLNTWLLFMDHDCSISHETLDFITKQTKPSSLLQNMVYSGSYINQVKSSYLQKGHNFIANTWLEQSYSSSKYNKLVLGGIFLIYSTQKIINFENFLYWGAEDKALAYELNSLNFLFIHARELTALHATSSAFSHFIRRAYLHGSNEIKYIKNNKNRINYLFWFRKIGFVNLNLLPLVLLHFCIQKMAILIQKVRRWNRRQMSCKNLKNLC